MRPPWWLLNIGSDNGLVLSGNKPLPELYWSSSMASQSYNEFCWVTVTAETWQHDKKPRYIHNGCYDDTPCWALSCHHCRIRWLSLELQRMRSLNVTAAPPSGTKIWYAARDATSGFIQVSVIAQRFIAETSTWHGGCSIASYLRPLE